MFDEILLEGKHSLGSWQVKCGQVLPPMMAVSVRVLRIKGDFDPLDLVAQLDGRSQLQVHALLHCGQREEQKSLSINVLRQERRKGHLVMSAHSHIFKYPDRRAL